MTEVCTSIYAFRRDLLGPALRNLNTDNSQGEFYLTDVIAGLAGMGHRIGAVQAPPAETQGVNDRWQLALAERELRNRTNRRWLLNGVTMLDPRQTFIDVTVTLGRDITIYPGTMLHGDTRIGDGTDLGPDTQLDNCSVGSGAAVSHTVGNDASIGDGATVGPYAYLPPGAAVVAGAVTGSVLHCTCRRLTLDRPRPGEGRPHGKGHHQEACALLGSHPPGTGPRGGPTLGAARRRRQHRRSSRTARSVRASPRAYAAPTCSSCRATTAIDGHSVNDSIMEQLTMIDAAYRASAKRITAVCPFYGYARQDRKAEGREPITARLVADMFKAAGAKRMISIDLHSGQIQGFFEGPVDHLTAAPVLEDYIRRRRPTPR